MAHRWKWLRPGDSEPLDRLRVDFYISREGYTEYLCASGVETGAQLSDWALVEAVRDHLKGATVLEPDEGWSENYSEADAAARGGRGRAGRDDARVRPGSRHHGIPYPAAVMMALQVAYAGCLAAAMMGGGS